MVLTRAERNMKWKSLHDRLVESHLWWGDANQLASDVHHLTLTIPQLLDRLKELNDRHLDYRDARAGITAELARQLAYRLPEMIERLHNAKEENA